MNRLLQVSPRKRKLDPLEYALKSTACACSTRCEKEICQQNTIKDKNRTSLWHKNGMKTSFMTHLDNNRTHITPLIEVQKMEGRNPVSFTESKEAKDIVLHTNDGKPFEMLEFSSLSVFDNLEDSQPMWDVCGDCSEVRKYHSCGCLAIRDMCKDSTSISVREANLLCHKACDHVEDEMDAMETESEKVGSNSWEGDTDDSDSWEDDKDESDSWEDDEEESSDDTDDEDEEKPGEKDTNKTAESKSNKHYRKRQRKDIERKIKRHIEEIERKMAILKYKEQRKRKRLTKCKKAGTVSTVDEPLPRINIHPIKRSKRLAQPLRCAVLKRHTLKNAWRGCRGSCCGKGCWSRWAWVNLKRVISEYW